MALGFRSSRLAMVQSYQVYLPIKDFNFQPDGRFPFDCEYETDLEVLPRLRLQIRREPDFEVSLLPLEQLQRK